MSRELGEQFPMALGFHKAGFFDENFGSLGSGQSLQSEVGKSPKLGQVARRERRIQSVAEQAVGVAVARARVGSGFKQSAGRLGSKHARGDHQGRVAVSVGEVGVGAARKKKRGQGGVLQFAGAMKGRGAGGVGGVGVGAGVQEGLRAGEVAAQMQRRGAAGPKLRLDERPLRDEGLDLRAVAALRGHQQLVGQDFIVISGIHGAFHGAVGGRGGVGNGAKAAGSS